MPSDKFRPSLISSSTSALKEVVANHVPEKPTAEELAKGPRRPLKPHKNSKYKMVRPEDFRGPRKYRTPFFIFSETVREEAIKEAKKDCEEKGIVFKITMTSKFIAERYKALSALEKERFQLLAIIERKDYIEKYNKWKNSNDCKAYEKKKREVVKERKIRDAVKELKAFGKPKKPFGAIIQFGIELKDVINAKLKGCTFGPYNNTWAQAKGKLVKQMWAALTDEERQQWHDNYQEERIQFHHDLKEFKQTAAFKLYEQKVAKARDLARPPMKNGKRRPSTSVRNGYGLDGSVAEPIAKKQKTSSSSSSSKGGSSLLGGGGADEDEYNLSEEEDIFDEEDDIEDEDSDDGIEDLDELGDDDDMQDLDDEEDDLFES